MIINAGVHCYDGRNTAAQWQPAMWPTFLRLLVGPAAANLNLKSSGPGPGPIKGPAGVLLVRDSLPVPVGRLRD